MTIKARWTDKDSRGAQMMGKEVVTSKTLSGRSGVSRRIAREMIRYGLKSGSLRKSGG